jgi:hypothetical protein
VSGPSIDVVTKQPRAKIETRRLFRIESTVRDVIKHALRTATSATKLWSPDGMETCMAPLLTKKALKYVERDRAIQLKEVWW